jgi:hypothetical protein
MRLRRLLCLITLSLVGGCNKVDIAPSEGDEVPFVSTVIFAGTLAPQGTRFLPFDVVQSSTAAVTLAGLRPSGTNTAVSVPLALSLGTVATGGTTCDILTTVTVTPALTSHISRDVTGGQNLCVQLSDPGNLTGDTDFAVRVQQSSALGPLGQAGTETFSTNLYPQGYANRTFAQSEGGPVTVRLTSASPAAALGLGLGVTQTGSDCYFSRTVVSTPGQPAELTADADLGEYCVRVFDPGGLPDRVLFSVQITHK